LKVFLDFRPSLYYFLRMNRLKILQYTYWQNGDFFFGFLNDYPEDSTQGDSLGELEEALTKIHETRQEEKRLLAKIRRTSGMGMSA